MILIADSGSTKVDWRFVADDGSVTSLQTSGINPVYLKKEEIVKLLQDEVSQACGGKADSIFFYGAGVVGESREMLESCFKEVFPDSACELRSDIVAAARALCGRSEGIACILGTGSNSCFYDGKEVVKNVRPGGFIIGDEGSGADLGKALVSDYIKGLLPRSIENAFRSKYKMEYADIVQKVYREPMPSRFLASFSPFIEAYDHHPHIGHIIETSFDNFLFRNVTGYDYARYPVNFIGSIAFVFKPYLEKSVKDCGMRMGVVMRGPIDGLVKYHTETI